jgi:hypothetical protein
VKMKDADARWYFSLDMQVVASQVSFGTSPIHANC